MKIFDEYSAETIAERLEKVKSTFEEIFDDSTGSVAAITPASLMLLGDHTHYNDGILLSVAINKYSIVVLRKRKDNKVNIVNSSNQKRIEFNINNVPEEHDIDFKYCVGLTKIFKSSNLISNGFDCVYSTEIPDCIGIGKYASLEVGFAVAIKKSFHLKIDIKELLDLTYKSELNIIGKISNRAHHYTTIYSKENKILFIDLRTLEHKTISLKDNFEIVVFDTGERINNSLKICNERIEECEIGVKGLRLYIWGIKNLRDVGLEFLLKHYHMLPKRIFNRVLYNVKERERVEKALVSLKKSSLNEFGNCLIESHWSISQDYELSCEKCDYIIMKSTESECSIGAKMISCSPLKCTYHVVKRDCSKKFIEHIQNSYRERYGEEFTAYTFSLSNGVKELSSKKISSTA